MFTANTYLFWGCPRTIGPTVAFCIRIETKYILQKKTISKLWSQQKLTDWLTDGKDEHKHIQRVNNVSVISYCKLNLLQPNSKNVTNASWENNIENWRNPSEPFCSNSQSNQFYSFASIKSYSFVLGTDEPATSVTFSAATVAPYRRMVVVHTKTVSPTLDASPASSNWRCSVNELLLQNSAITYIVHWCCAAGAFLEDVPTYHFWGICLKRVSQKIVSHWHN